MIGPCKFCGCSDDRPCMIPVCLAPDGDALERARAMMQEPCAWLLDDVCSNPVCVEKAYAEARPLAEQIDEALRMEDVA